MKQFVNWSIGIMWMFCALTVNGASEQQSNSLAGTTTSTQSSAPSAVEVTIRSSFKLSRPDITIEKITASVVSGIYQVKIKDGPVLYTSSDGRYFILGDMYAAAPNGFVNIAEQSREGDRAKLMATVDPKDMIIFSPAQMPAKATIMVFTDVDCFYCQKLHREVPDLNRIGIEVRYLAYPRAGVGSNSYKKIATAWCSVDKKATLTKLKNRQNIATNVCPENPVASQFDLGQEIGVSGTPALVTSKGQLFPGYMPALRLASVLGVDVDPILAAELKLKEEAQKK